MDSIRTGRVVRMLRFARLLRLMKMHAGCTKMLYPNFRKKWLHWLSTASPTTPPRFYPKAFSKINININWYLATPKSCLAHHHITDIYALSWYLFFWSYQICITFITTLKKQTTPNPNHASLRFGLLDFLGFFQPYPTLHQPPRFFPHLLTQPKQRPDLGSIIHQQTFRKTLLDEGLCRLGELSPWTKNVACSGYKGDKEKPVKYRASDYNNTMK